MLVFTWAFQYLKQHCCTDLLPLIRILPMKVFKHLVILLLLTVLFVWGESFIYQLLTELLKLHDKLNDLLGSIFSASDSGVWLRKTFSIVLIPLGLASILGLGYWFSKKKTMPGLLPIIWVSWAVVMTLLLYTAHTVIKA